MVKWNQSGSWGGRGGLGFLLQKRAKSKKKFKSKSEKSKEQKQEIKRTQNIDHFLLAAKLQ